MSKKPANPLLDSLNPAQQEAVMCLDGPLLILAGAGSGKTRVLTHRTAYLMTQGIPGRNILAVTFTNKAAAEMKTRIENLLAEVAQGKTDGTMPTIGTFHAICARLLRSEIKHLGRESSFVIYDTNDQKAAIKRALNQLNLDPASNPPAAILAAISQAKNELLPPVEYAERTKNDVLAAIVARVYPIYQRIMLEENALDFDDLIGLTVELFKQHSTILEKYQERWPYIMVDEYQDTNKAQYMLVKMLSEKHKNLCVVGDDWQGIYSWRGADIRNILEFNEDYPDAKEVKLEENYRSTKKILDAAQRIIEKNQKRTDKKLFTSRDEGDQIQVFEAYDERHEGQIVADLIDELQLSHGDVAILYRTNAQSRAIEEAMLRGGVPYQVIGGTKFYDRKEVKDVLAYLYYIVNPQATTALLRIINVPSRKIGPTSLAKVTSTADQRSISLCQQLYHLDEVDGLVPSFIKAVDKFNLIIDGLRHLAKQQPASEVLKAVIKRTGYGDSLQDGTDEGMERYQNVLELISVAKKYDNLEPGTSLMSFLEEVALVSDIDGLKEGETAVTLMTLHNAKGLEYSNVFIVGMEEGIFPHSRSLVDPAQAEEERRLCYVGMTRAQDRLFLINARQRQLYGATQMNPPSRFIADLPGEITDIHSSRRGVIMPEATSGNIQISSSSRRPQSPARPKSNVVYSVGDRVKHTSFGVGEILEVRGDILAVEFENGSLKKLVASIAPLEIIHGNSDQEPNEFDQRTEFED
jgi:DNA helicase-2/ATP-dependent DNA helicase PcrA